MGKILDWLQEHVKHWINPVTSVLFIGALSDLIHSRTNLVIETVLLRQQLIVVNRQIKRPQLTNLVRFRLSVPIALYDILETSPIYRSTGYFVALASGIV